VSRSLVFLNNGKNLSAGIFLSSYVGNTLETYDFVLCGVLAMKLAAVFFPLENGLTSLLLTLMAYGIGFVFRPLGAIFFGYIGDIYGRKIAMSYALLGMSGATACFGFLPDFSQIGIYAPILFIALRSIQGFCIGGESQGGSTFIVEHFWHNQPAKYGAFFATSNGMGALLASLVGLYFMAYSGDFATSWRIPFLCGAMVGFVGIFIRLFVPETPVFNQSKADTSQKINPIKAAFKNNFLGCVRVFFFVALISSITHLGFTFINAYLAGILKFSNLVALKFASLGTLLAMLGVFLSGFLFKKISPHWLIRIVCFLSILLIPISLLLLSTNNNFNICLSLLIMAIITGGLCGAAPFFIAIHFKREFRYTGSSLLNNLAQGFLGGFFPTIALWLLQKFSNILFVATYLVGLVILFLVVDFYIELEKKNEFKKIRNN
jgi:MHS family proline/betaine transporter-like MFS transporter